MHAGRRRLGDERGQVGQRGLRVCSARRRPRAARRRSRAGRAAPAGPVRGRSRPRPPARLARRRAGTPTPRRACPATTGGGRGRRASPGRCACARPAWRAQRVRVARPRPAAPARAATPQLATGAHEHAPPHRRGRQRRREQHRGEVGPVGRRRRCRGGSASATRTPPPRRRPPRRGAARRPLNTATRPAICTIDDRKLNGTINRAIASGPAPPPPQRHGGDDTDDHLERRSRRAAGRSRRRRRRGRRTPIANVTATTATSTDAPVTATRSSEAIGGSAVTRPRWYGGRSPAGHRQRSTFAAAGHRPRSTPSRLAAVATERRARARSAHHRAHRPPAVRRCSWPQRARSTHVPRRRRRPRRRRLHERSVAHRRHAHRRARRQLRRRHGAVRRPHPHAVDDGARRARHGRHPRRARVHRRAPRGQRGRPARARRPRLAAERGLHVWLEPRPFDATPADAIELFVTVGRLRRADACGGTDVVMSLGVEHSLFLDGLVPGADFWERAANLASTDFERLGRDLDAFLADAVAAVRPAFGGPLTYSSGLWEDGRLGPVRHGRRRPLPRRLERGHVPPGRPGPAPPRQARRDHRVRVLQLRRRRRSRRRGVHDRRLERPGARAHRQPRP